MIPAAPLALNSVTTRASSSWFRYGFAGPVLRSRGQPGDREDPLERDREPRSAGGEDDQSVARQQQVLDQRGDPVDQVLAVVEHEQQIAPGEPRGQPIGE